MSVRENVVKSLEALISMEGSKSSFAKKIGVSRAAVTNWTSGLNAPDIETIAKIATVYSVPLSGILEGKLNSPSKGGRTDTPWVEVPLFGSIAAGTPIEMDRVERTFVIPSEIHERYPDAFLLRVEGESMNRRIPNGSYALVNPTKEVIDGNVYAVCVNGYDATIKRVRRLENGFELTPDSTDPTIRPMVYDYGVEGTDTVTVIGEVVWCVYPYDFRF